MGDLNLSNINWESCCITGNSYPLTLCNMMIDCIQECGFSQVINFPTRISNILDIFFTNRPSLIRKCHPLPGISDHEILYLELSIEVQLTIMSKRKILVLSRAGITTIKSIALNFNTCFLKKQHSMTSPVNTLWDEFQDMCQRCLDLIPTRLIATSCKKPWNSQLCKVITISILLAKMLIVKKEIQKECRKATNYVSTLVNDNGHVNKKLWTFIKSQRKDHCGVAPLKYNSKIHDDTTMKTDILNNYFTSVFIQDSEAPPPPIQGPPFPDISPIAINCDGVAQL